MRQASTAIALNAAIGSEGGDTVNAQQLAIGMRVHILLPFYDGIYRDAIIYEHIPGRPWEWHVRVVGWPHDEDGMAFATDELEPLHKSYQPNERTHL